MNIPASEPISALIPVYNSQDTLQPLVERLDKVLSEQAPAYEIILVNDGSRDDSWNVITRLVQAYPSVTGINLMRNYGQHNALLAGLRQAQHPVIVTLDDDLQHPPEELPKLLRELERGYDVVYGTPQRMPHSAWRNVTSSMTKKILSFVMGLPGVKEISAFRAFRANLRNAFIDYKNPGIILDVLLSWGTTRFSHVTVNEMPRESGRSNYSFGKLASQAILILTGYSTVPLRFASWFGFALTLFGIVIFLKVVIDYFLLGSIPGFTFLASIISLFSGAILFALGIFGEYLSRIFDSSMQRPAYTVADIVKSDDEDNPGGDASRTTP